MKTHTKLAHTHCPAKRIKKKKHFSHTFVCRMIAWRIHSLSLWLSQCFCIIIYYFLECFISLVWCAKPSDHAIQCPYPISAHFIYSHMHKRSQCVYFLCAPRILKDTLYSFCICSRAHYFFLVQSCCHSYRLSKMCLSAVHPNTTASTFIAEMFCCTNVFLFRHLDCN